MASTDELVRAIKALDDEQKAEVGRLLAPHVPVTMGRRQLLGLGALAAVGGGAGAGVPYAARAAIDPAAAADGVLSDIDTIKSGDGSAITLVNDLVDDAGTPNTLIDESVPSWEAAVGATSAVPSVTTESASISDVFTLPEVNRTISSGAVTVDSTAIRVSAESGSTDDLETLSGGSADDWVLLRGTSGDTITVKHGTGNILLDGQADKSLSNGADLLLLKFSGSNWLQIAFSNNG